jgi:hypothetical protein
MGTGSLRPCSHTNEQTRTPNEGDPHCLESRGNQQPLQLGGNDLGRRNRKVQIFQVSSEHRMPCEILGPKNDTVVVVENFYRARVGTWMSRKS